MASLSKLLRAALENWPAKVIAVGVAIVIVLFNDLSRTDERYFSVPLTLRLDPNVIPGADYPGRVRVRLRGDEDTIFAIVEDDIVAYADFTDHTDEGIFRAPILVDRRGSALDAEALEIVVEPLTVTVNLEEKLVASLEVVPNIVGFPQAGYELSDYRVSPTTVDVVGPRSRIEGISQVLTEEISLTGRTTDFTERVRLSRPDALVSFPGGEIVDFRALITETVIRRDFEDVPIQVAGLSPRLRLASPLPSGTIQTQGKQLDLDGIPEGRIGLFVDASRINSPGTYSLPTRPQIPSGVLVLGVDPAQVEVELVIVPADSGQGGTQ